MLKKFVSLFLIIVMTFGLNAQNVQLYPTKSGMIKYTFEGRTNGTETIYFDDYGKLLSVLKTTSTESDLSIFRNDTLFKINIPNNTVTIYADNQTVKSKLISPEMIEMLGYEKLSNENIVGVSCITYSGKNGKLWVWNNIVLKSEMEIMDISISSEAVIFKTDIVIPPSKFETPKNYKIIN